MAKITLQRLTIDNFKGCRHFEFAPLGSDCTIAGDNATGKTTVYDALVWLLFGKDSRGRKDFDIKPLAPDGTVADHAAITSVEALLDCDGEEKALKRTYAEKWTTKRGRSDAEFDGHESEYFVDQVPVKKNAFDDAVSGMVDETMFRLLTNVSYFPETMKWQERRSMLFDLAGIQSDEEIMATDQTFVPLLEALGGKSVEDYKKVLTAQRKGLAKTKSDTPARIDEQTKTVQELIAIDFDGLRAQREDVAARGEGYRTQLSTMRSEDAAARLRDQRSALEAQAKALEAENTAHRSGQLIGAPAKDAARKAVHDAQQMLNTAENTVHDLQVNAAEYENRVEQFRAQYRTIATEEFSTPDTCPTCGQKLPKSRIETAQAAWTADQEKRLAYVVAQAEEFKERQARNAERLEKALEQRDAVKAALEQRQAELADIPDPAPVTDLPDYAARKAEISAQIAETDRLIANACAPAKQAEADLEQKIADARVRVSQLDAAIAQQARLTAAQQRIEELQEQARKASSALEELDAMLFLIEDFSRYKAHYVEDSINGMFDHATFRLFREQINGGLEECCDVVYQGVPYTSLNNGARINVGIDIIRTIGTRTGISVPLLVDNAEAVTALWQSGSQQIRLVVDETAKELTIK